MSEARHGECGARLVGQRQRGDRAHPFRDKGRKGVGDPRAPIAAEHREPADPQRVEIKGVLGQRDRLAVPGCVGERKRVPALPRKSGTISRRPVWCSRRSTLCHPLAASGQPCSSRTGIPPVPGSPGKTG